MLARVNEIAALPGSVEDGVQFLLATTTVGTIREGDRYGGVRVTMHTVVGGAKVKLRLVISTVDPVSPPPAMVAYPTLRPAHPALVILGYPRPVVLAEKQCTALEVGPGKTLVP